MLLQFPASAPHRAREIGGSDELLAIAREVATRAPSWPSMARPAFGSPLIRRRWDLRPASGTVEAWVIAWPPGGAIALHDHGGAAGAIVVAIGELAETTMVRRSDGEIGLQTRTIGKDGSIQFAGPHVHGLANTADTPAISVHVYSTPVTSLTYYEDRGTEPVLCTCANRSGEVLSRQRVLCSS
jgi:hypothetical protein